MESKDGLLRNQTRGRSKEGKDDITGYPWALALICAFIFYNPIHSHPIGFYSEH